MTRVYIAAGGNIEPVASLSQALALLRATWPDIRCSRAYQNAAAGFEGDDFINLAAGFTTDLSLAQVLA
jgi:2-amino-4-hydroxy-6-hydroxymethyldihydropteridine diphosphokinase